MRCDLCGGRLKVKNTADSTEAIQTYRKKMIEKGNSVISWWGGAFVVRERECLTCENISFTIELDLQSLSDAFEDLNSGYVDLQTSNEGKEYDYYEYKEETLPDLSEKEKEKIKLDCWRTESPLARMGE